MFVLTVVTVEFDERTVPLADIATAVRFVVVVVTLTVGPCTTTRVELPAGAGAITAVVLPGAEISHDAE